MRSWKSFKLSLEEKGNVELMTASDKKKTADHKKQLEMEKAKSTGMRINSYERKQRKAMFKRGNQKLVNSIVKSSVGNNST